MKTLIKSVSIGDYKFYVGVDRHIVVEVFEAFPDLMEYLLSQKNGAGDNTIVIDAIKNKSLETLLEATEKIGDLVKFAFPLLLAKADKEKKTHNADKAEEIYDYICENEVDEEFNNAMFEFICSGFTADTAERKPKVKFVMK